MAKILTDNLYLPLPIPTLLEKSFNISYGFLSLLKFTWYFLLALQKHFVHMYGDKSMILAQNSPKNN